MSKIDNGGPAFPFSHKDITAEGGEFAVYRHGMSLRDWFAGQALAGICASGPGTQWTDARIASAAYAMADAMIEARKVKP